MKLDISELLNNPGSHQSYELNEPCPSDFTCDSRVTGNLSFTTTSNLLIIRGDIHADVRVECTRCLTEFTYPVHAEVSEEFRFQEGEVVADASQPSSEEGEDDILDLFEGVQLNLDELVRQYLHLGIPLSSLLCSEECKGLCPQCGTDLNREPCTCVRPPAESPLAGLARFLPDESEK